MSVFALISLLLSILFKLPTYITTITAIIALVRSMRDKNFMQDLEILGEILRLILGLIPLNRDFAKSSLTELKSVLEQRHATGLGDTGTLVNLKNSLENEKRKCEGNFCPADTK